MFVCPLIVSVASFLPSDSSSSFLNWSYDSECWFSSRIALTGRSNLSKLLRIFVVALEILVSVFCFLLVFDGLVRLQVSLGGLESACFGSRCPELLDDVDIFIQCKFYGGVVFFWFIHQNLYFSWRIVWRIGSCDWEGLVWCIDSLVSLICVCRLKVTFLRQHFWKLSVSINSIYVWCLRVSVIFWDIWAVFCYVPLVLVYETFQFI